MSAIITLKENGISAQCKQKISKNNGKILVRSELMSLLLNNNLDTLIKKELSIIYDLIVDLETENKTYITQIKLLEVEHFLFSNSFVKI